MQKDFTKARVEKRLGQTLEEYFEKSVFSGRPRKMASRMAAELGVTPQAVSRWLNEYSHAREQKPN